MRHTLWAWAISAALLGASLQSADANVINYSIQPLSQNLVVNLTQEGTVDWAQWSRFGMTHKGVSGAPVNIIGDYVQYDSGLSSYFSDATVGFSWIDGIRTATIVDTRSGAYRMGEDQGMTVPIFNDGTLLDLKLYVCLNNSSGQLLAKWDQPLTYGSGMAADYVGPVVTSANGRTFYEIDMTFSSAFPRTLYVTFCNTSSLGDGDYVGLQAVSLHSAPEPTTCLLLAVGGLSVWLRRSPRRAR